MKNWVLIKISCVNKYSKSFLNSSPKNSVNLLALMSLKTFDWDSSVEHEIIFQQFLSIQWMVQNNTNLLYGHKTQLKLPSAGVLMTYRRKLFILVQELSLVWMTFGVFGQPCWCPGALFHINASEMLQYSWILSLDVSLAFRCLRTHIHVRLWRICV